MAGMLVVGGRGDMGDKLSKDHHYVPQGILRRFCFEGETTYYLSKERFPDYYRAKKSRYTAGVEERNIKTVFKRRHYNSYIAEDGKKYDFIERFFAKELDDYIPRWINIFEASLANRTSPSWDSQLRDRFVQFFITMP